MAVEASEVLSTSKLLEALAIVDPTTRTLILHCLGQHDRLHERIGELEQIVYVLKKSYRLLKFGWPAIVAIAAYALGTR